MEYRYEDRKWKPQVKRWWEVAWASPMAAAWSTGDLPALERLAICWQAVCEGDSAHHTTTAAMAEARQLEDRLGLNPLARRRLSWEIGQAAGQEASRAALERQQVDDLRLRLVSGE